MEKPKLWRLEVHNPTKSNEWRTVRELNSDQVASAAELRNKMNRTNAPALVRIVRKTGF